MGPQQESLLHYRTISITKINEETKRYVNEALEIFIKNGAPDIFIIINSDGGNHYKSMEIFYMLSTYPGKITGYVQSYAFSGAVTILQGCSVRKMCADAKLILHEPTTMKYATDFYKIKTIEDIEKIKKELEACLKEICLIFSIRSCRYSPDFFTLLCRYFSIITADEALELGLVDEII